MTPTIAIAGRPNVGKSTLFNRLAGRRIAIVADTPGVTRDRKSIETTLAGRQVNLVDTAGMEESAPESLAGRMRASSGTAVAEADLVLLVIDGRAGVTPPDEALANWLRRQKRPLLLVVNKAEGAAGSANALDAYRLGLGDPVAISAEHNEGIATLIDEICERLPPEAAPGPDEDDEGHGADRPLKLAIVGRPNAGKSTLVNHLLGEERMLTGAEPGLTRDAIASRFDDAQGLVEIVDTAGLRKRARVDQDLEKLATGASIYALKMAEVVVLVVDATLGMEDQDLTIARLVEREGRACVIALNKWDAVADRQATRGAINDRLETSLAQMKGIALVPLSALTGVGLDKLMPAVREAHRIWNLRVPTSALNRWLEDALDRHAPPLVQGRRLKIRYVTQPKARPPTFTAFGTRVELMPEDYQRYLVNLLRTNFGLAGVPIRLQLRGTKNPYQDDQS